LLLLSHIANFEPILSTSEALVVVVESKRQHGTIYIHQKNNRQSLVLQGNDAALVSLYSSVPPRVLEYVTHVAIAMHNCFPDQMFDQRKPTMCRFSMDTALCLETIVHFYSYTCCLLQAQGPYLNIYVLIQYIDSDSQQSREPSAKIQKFFWDTVPPGSPTEVNTPSPRYVTPALASTAANTPNLRFMHPLTSIEEGLGDRSCQPVSGQNTPLSDSEEKRPGSRARTPLPTYPAGYENTCSPSPALPKARVSPWGSSIDIKPTFLAPQPVNLTASSPELTKALGGLLQQMLPNIIEGAFSSILGPLIDARLEALVHQKMEALVQAHLPKLTHQALQQNMDKFIDDLSDEHRNAEVIIGDAVDEAKTELNETRDRAIDDIETWAQERFADFDGDVVSITKSAVETLEDKTNVLEERLDRKFRGCCRRIGKVHRSMRRSSI
jgi:hypothetical protein